MWCWLVWLVVDRRKKVRMIEGSYFVQKYLHRAWTVLDPHFSSSEKKLFCGKKKKDWLWLSSWLFFFWKLMHSNSNRYKVGRRDTAEFVPSSTIQKFLLFLFCRWEQWQITRLSGWELEKLVGSREIPALIVHVNKYNLTAAVALAQSSWLYLIIQLTRQAMPGQGNRWK